MAWTVISDATLEVGKALRALTMRNLRDNFAAMAAGDAGAPQIQTAAIAAGVVTNAKMAAGSVAAGNIIDGNVTSAKLATGVNEGNWVVARTAAANTGDIGSYALMRNATNRTCEPGGNYAGFLQYADGNGTNTSAVVGGTWKCMGRGVLNSGIVFLRIA